MSFNPYQPPEHYLKASKEKKCLTAKELIARLRKRTNQQLSWIVDNNCITATLLPAGNGWSKNKEVFILSGSFGEKGETSDFIDIGANGKFNKVQNGVVEIHAKNYAAKLLLQIIPTEESSSDKEN